jgi:hypothetical protein
MLRKITDAFVGGVSSGYYRLGLKMGSSTTVEKLLKFFGLCLCLIGFANTYSYGAINVWKFAKLMDLSQTTAGFGRFDSFGAPNFDGRNVVFNGSANGVSGIYVVGPSGPAMVASVGQTMSAGGVFQSFEAPVISSGNVAFMANGSTYSGVFLSAPVTSGAISTRELSTVADTVSMAAPGLRFTGFDADSPSVSDNTVGFTAFSLGNNGAYLRNGNTLVSLADRHNTSQIFFSKLAIDSASEYVVQGQSATGGGIYTNVGGALRPVVDSTTPVPGYPGETFHFDGTVGRNHTVDAGQIEFFNNGGNNPSTGIWVERSPGELRKVVDGNTIIPGSNSTLRGVKFYSFSGGNTVFSAMDNAFKIGLYSDFGGSLQEIINPGDLFDGKTVRAIGFSAQSFQGNSFAFEADFSGGTSGLYVGTATVPEPTGLIIILLALNVVARRPASHQ